MREEPTTPKHQLVHELPTVIHHADDDRTALARWLDRAMEHPVRFWGLIAASAVVLLVLSVLGSGLTLGTAASNTAWARLETARTAAERVEIARDFPRTTAERWALLQAATEYYRQGFADLPSNKDVALPTLKKALDLFQKVADEAPRGSTQARVAALGLARTLEARNELDKAAQKYEAVASTKEWAGTPEAREAARLAALVKKPEAATFYKELYAYKAPEVTIPPGEVGDIKLPAGFDFAPKAGAPTKGSSFLPNVLDLPPPPPTPATPTTDIKMPASVFAPEAPAPKPEAPAPKPEAPAPKPEAPAPKPETPATQPESPKPAPSAETPAPGPEGGLPGDVFSPAPAKPDVPK